MIMRRRMADANVETMRNFGLEDEDVAAWPTPGCPRTRSSIG
jgi:hypothetical protein